MMVRVKWALVLAGVFLALLALLAALNIISAIGPWLLPLAVVLIGLAILIP